MFLFPATYSPAAVHCVLLTLHSSGPCHEGKLPFSRNFSMKMISDSKDFGTTGKRRPTATSVQKISVIWLILMELLTGKLRVSLPRYLQPSGGALCVADCTQQRPRHDGQLLFSRNYSMKIISDNKDFGTTGKRRPKATSLQKMSVIWSILMELLTGKLGVSLPRYLQPSGGALCVADCTQQRPLPRR